MNIGVLRGRCVALVIVLIGKNAASSWWSSANLAFGGKTPAEMLDLDAQMVYDYLTKHQNISADYS